MTAKISCFVQQRNPVFKALKSHKSNIQTLLWWPVAQLDNWEIKLCVVLLGGQ